MTDSLESVLPRHEAGLTLEHDPHKGRYATAEEYITSYERYDEPDCQLLAWLNLEDRERAIRENTFWAMQWYPDTPVGFLCVAASTFDVLMEAASQVGSSEYTVNTPQGTTAQVLQDPDAAP